MVDNDRDSHIHVGLDVKTPGQSVTNAPDLCEAPGDNPNPETWINVKR